MVSVPSVPPASVTVSPSMVRVKASWTAKTYSPESQLHAALSTCGTTRMLYSPPPWFPNSVTVTPHPPGRTLNPSRRVQPVGRAVALVWSPALAPRSSTGSPSSVTRTLIKAEAATFAPESPAAALLRLILSCTSSSRCDAPGFFFPLAMVSSPSPNAAPRYRHHDTTGRVRLPVGRCATCDHRQV